MKSIFIVLSLLLIVESSFAQDAWYEKFSLRGYGQIRHNHLGSPDKRLLSSQGDRSVGGNNNFFIRRARFAITGDVADNVTVYIQPDLVSTPDGSDSNNFAQLRDFYADVFLDSAKESRLRIGQSKLPFGFENMQSSQNRLPLDRNDAMNTAARDERDIGVFYYWAPAEIRERFKDLVDSGLKGSGDFGLIGVGAYNGQNANRNEANNRLHYVARITYPFLFENGQYLETSVQAYTGHYTVGGSAPGAAENPLNIAYDPSNKFRDQRTAATFVYYPQPFGVQAEYTVGEGPELNDAQSSIETSSLHGGYVQLMYQIKKAMLFGRAQTYRGGRKHEDFAPAQTIDETELGVEYQFNKAMELTASYSWTDRTSSVSPYENFDGNLTRFQFQFNF